MASAAIRFNNPGAMWGKDNRIATKWGATSTTVLNDGLGQGNNIAYFPTKIQGACAQFDLWRTGYCNMTLRNAILKWSGHNWSEPYAQSLCAASGLTLDTIITPEVLASLRGLRLIVAQAKWEAGTVYPLTTAEWLQAQDQVFRNAPPVSVRTKKAAGAGAVVVAGGGAAATAASQGHHWGVVLLILIVAVVGGGVAWFVIHRRHEKATTPPLPKAFSAIGGPVVSPESSPIPRFGAPL